MTTCHIMRNGKELSKLDNITLDKLLNSSTRNVVVRSYGNIGDLVMIRMIFEDMKKLTGDQVYFVCSEPYLGMMEDHPFLDGCFAWESVGDFNNPKLQENFYMSANIDRSCIDYENEMKSKTDKHRSDIWANSFGLELQNHNPHVCLTREDVSRAHDLLNEQVGPGKKMLIAGWTTTPIKDIPNEQVEWVLDFAKQNNIKPFIFHHKSVEGFGHVTHVKAPTFKDVFSICAASDWAVTADTGALHAAGAVGLPVLGVFGHTGAAITLKYYPNSVGLQISSDPSLPEYKECAPCYSWSTCPFLGESKFPPVCLKNLPRNAYAEKLEQLVSLEHAHSYRTVPSIISCRTTLSDVLK